MVVDFLHKYFSKSVRTSYMMALKHDGNVLPCVWSLYPTGQKYMRDELSEVAQNGNNL